MLSGFQPTPMHEHRRQASVKLQSRVGDIAVYESDASVKLVDRRDAPFQWAR